MVRRQQQQRRERGPFFRVFFPSLFSFFLLSLAHFFTFVWNREGERSQTMARTQNICETPFFFSPIFDVSFPLGGFSLPPRGEESLKKVRYGKKREGVF